MAATEIRAKEATIQLTVDGQRLGGSFSTIKGFNVKPDVEMPKKRFTGQSRSVADLDVKGYGFSFKTEKRDHLWLTLWKKIEQAELNHLVFPVISIAVSYQYRDGIITAPKTITLHGDLVMHISGDDIPDGYAETSWEGFSSYLSGQ